MQTRTVDKNIEKEIKDLIQTKMSKKGIKEKQRIEMDNGGVYLENLLFDFAVSFRKQERYKIKEDISKGILHFNEY